MPYFPLALVLAAALGGKSLSSQPSERWTQLYVGQSGFDDRNFNQTITNQPKLLNPAGWVLLRRRVLSGAIRAPAGNVVIFGLIDGDADFGIAKFSKCRRLGNLQINEAPRLMDAQACKVEGEAEVLLGSAQSAAAVRMKTDHGSIILILDQAFLGRRAPVSNAVWLENAMGLL
jgi:hypothetical protein